MVLGVYSTDGLSLRTTATLAGSGDVVGTLASPTLTRTLAVADRAGWLVLRVENRGAGTSVGDSYRVELRKTMPPPIEEPQQSQQPSIPEPLQPDSLENNWSGNTAPIIAPGVVYDLYFVCPVRRRLRGRRSRLRARAGQARGALPRCHLRPCARCRYRAGEFLVERALPAAAEQPPRIFQGMFPRAQRQRVLAWANCRYAELLLNWEKAQQGHPLDWVEP